MSKTVYSKIDLNMLIPLREASKICGLSPDHLRRLAEQGKLDAKKIGRNWITTKEAITKYMEKRKPRGRPKTGLTVSYKYIFYSTYSGYSK